jgi:hypothetical protein
MDLRIYQRWDHVARRSKHPLSHPPWVLILVQENGTFVFLSVTSFAHARYHFRFPWWHGSHATENCGIWLQFSEFMRFVIKKIYFVNMVSFFFCICTHMDLLWTKFLASRRCTFSCSCRLVRVPRVLSKLQCRWLASWYYAILMDGLFYHSHEI